MYAFMSFVDIALMTTCTSGRDMESNLEAGGH